MRVTVKYTVSGSNIEEMIKSATKDWKEMSGMDSLPADTEIDITDAQNKASDYEATVYVRMKREVNG